MGLVKEYLTSISSVHIYAVIAMLLFMVTFLFMMYHAYSIKKDDIKHFGELPLDTDENDHNEN